MDENKGVDFPIDLELLSSATQIKEQWKVIKDRFQKIKDHKGKVSPPVFERVLADYDKRLKEITEKVLEKKRAIDRELLSLYETRKKIASQLESHRHIMEEFKFRNVLGEFTEDEYQQKTKDEQEKISKFETILSAVNTNISRYEDLFKDETDLLPAEGKVRVEKVEEDLFAAAESAESADEFLSGIEDQNYFTGPETTSPSAEEHKTLKTTRGKRKEVAEAKARIVIITGDDAGATYPVKGVVTFGRADTNTVVLRDAKVSRQHAKIVQKGNEYVLLDLNSSNGTFVNGERIEEHVLAGNDELQIGDIILQFQI